MSQEDSSLSLTQRTISTGQDTTSPDQCKTLQDDFKASNGQNTTLSSCSISSDQRSHGRRASSGTLPSDVGSADPNMNLYSKLGGPEALEAAVDMFYDRVLADERLKHFFDGTNMMRLVIKQVTHVPSAPPLTSPLPCRPCSSLCFPLSSAFPINPSAFV